MSELPEGVNIAIAIIVLIGGCLGIMRYKNRGKQ